MRSLLMPYFVSLFLYLNDCYAVWHYRKRKLGYPVMVGSSRKRFLGLVGRAEGRERPPTSRDTVTAMTSAYAAAARVWCVRVHDVVATRDAFDVVAALGPLAPIPVESPRSAGLIGQVRPLVPSSATPGEVSSE